MQPRNKYQPGHQGCVLHRVPCPVAAKVQRFISPCPTHHNASTQHCACLQAPYYSGLHKFGIVFFPEGCYAISKRYKRRRKAQEQNRRMYHHPVVLQQYIQAIAIAYHIHIVRQCKYGRPKHAHTQQLEGGTAYFYFCAQPYAQQHGAQAGLNKGNDGHGAGLQASGSKYDNSTQHTMPKCPEHEAALLPFPKA